MAIKESTAIDSGVLTTPQLHYLVRCHNDPDYGQASEVGYYAKLSSAFKILAASAPKDSVLPLLKVDCANGVGAPQFRKMLAGLEGVLSAEVCNDGSNGRLNDGCGADYVKTKQTAPPSMKLTDGDQCASFDGDADRLMFCFQHKGDVQILDGDRIAILVAVFLSQKLSEAGLDGLKLGVVQTAYANGGSTQHLKALGIPVACAKTGVKHLHHLALEYDVGVYFEANGHGTVLFSDRAIKAITAAATADGAAQAALDLKAAVDLINQTVGDAMSDLLLVVAVLAHTGLDFTGWAAMYDDLPNRLLKVKIADRSVVQTTNAERTCTSPDGVQPAIDAAVANYTSARSFVRPSGTEDVVRVYAEAATQAETDNLALAVCRLVHELCDGVGELPTI